MDSHKEVSVEFDWDPEKDQSNVKKHGISFEDAIAIFDQPHTEKVDDRTDYGEERMVAYGYVQGFPLVGSSQHEQRHLQKKET